MSQKSIYDAFDAYMTASVGSIPGAAIANVAFLGATYVPEAQTPFLALSMPAIGGRMLSTGTLGLYEWRGTFQVSCFWPIGVGKEEVTAQGDAVRGLFPNGFSLATDDGFTLRFFAPTVRPMLLSGAWNMVPVHMPWFLHEVTA